MSKQSIKATIDNNVYQNNEGRITGVVMNSVLKAMVDNEYDELLKGYKFGGIVSPIDQPSSSSAENMFYIASTIGTYPYFGNLTKTSKDKLTLFYRNIGGESPIIPIVPTWLEVLSWKRVGWTIAESTSNVISSSSWTMYYIKVNVGDVVKFNIEYSASNAIRWGFSSIVPNVGGTLTDIGGISTISHEQVFNASADGYYVCAVLNSVLTSITASRLTTEERTDAIDANILSSVWGTTDFLIKSNSSWKVYYFPIEEGKSYRLITDIVSSSGITDIRVAFSSVVPANGVVVENVRYGSTTPLDADITAPYDGYLCVTQATSTIGSINLYRYAEVVPPTPTPTDDWTKGEMDMITLDSNLSTTSTNPVQNKAIKLALDGKQERLIAGRNISIVGNTISVVEEGGGGDAWEWQSIMQLSPKYIKTNGAIGSVVDINGVTNASYNHQIIPCVKGERYRVSGLAGDTPRLWAFTDGTYVLYSQSAKDINATEYIELTAPIDGFLIFNANISGSYLSRAKCEKLVQVREEDTNEEGFQKVTNGEELPLVYGHFSSSGRYNFDVMGLTLPKSIKVKSGSSISSDGEVEFQVVTYLDGVPTYRGFSTSAFSVDDDCTLKFSVRYLNSAPCYGYDILKHLTLNIITDSFGNRFDKRNSVTYGNAPKCSYYVGQHTDTTGNAQSTTYDATIAQWDTLVDNVYITKEDLGETYNGKHIYCYTLTPPSQPINRKTPKVVLVSGLHGHEKSGTYGLLYLIKDMLDNPMAHPVLEYLRNNVTLVIIPCANVYGWNANSRYNQNGVNLNRNFYSQNWDTFTSDDYTTPWEYNYKGTAPFSELESQKIRSVILKNYDASLLLDIHTNGLNTQLYSELCWISTPYLSVGDYDLRMRDITPSFLQTLKTPLDYVYGVNGGRGQFYGDASVESQRPTLECWGAENANFLSATFEVPCGSNDTKMGAKLTKYSPDLIKCCAEMIGNFIVTILGQLE